MVIWLASYPRSGNTFFRIILKNVFGLDNYSIYDDPGLVNMGASNIIGQSKLKGSIDELDESDEIYIIKTHELRSDSRKAIYLVRDGRDVLTSYSKYIYINNSNSRNNKIRNFLRIRTPKTILNRIIVADKQYGNWCKHIHSWLPEDSRKDIVLVRYEDLLQDPVLVTKRALASLGVPVDKVLLGSLPSFESLNEKWPGFFRKGKVNSWKEEMSESQQKKFWQINGECMKKLGYSR